MSELSFYDKTRRPWVGTRLTNASIVGHTTRTTTRLWVRAWEKDKHGQPTDGEGLYWLAVAKKPIPRTGQPEIRKAGGKPALHVGGTGKVKTAALTSISLRYSTDLTGVVDVTGLAAGKRYYYALFAGFERPQRWEVGGEDDLCFTTVPSKPERVSFGLFSCHQPFKKGNIVRTEMWNGFYEALDAAAATHAIGTGDQVYVDGLKEADIWAWLRKVKDDPALDPPVDMVSWYRDIYRGFWGHPLLQRVLARFPTYMIWDDHEIMDGWGSFTSAELGKKLAKHATKKQRKRYRELIGQMFEAAQQVYTEYQHSHNPPTPSGRWDYTFTTGPIATCVLDMRGHRNFAASDGERILGGAQLRRVVDWLASDAARDAGVVFVVASVPVVHHRSWVVNRFDHGGLKDDLRDQWEHDSNWQERRVLLDAVGKLSQETGRRVVFLSGDVHMSAAFRLFDRDNPGARVYQLTSSGITYSGKARIPSIPFFGNRIGDYVVPDEGFVAGTGKRWSFEGIQEVIEAQNFALLHCTRRPGGDVDVTWDLHGASDSESDGVVRYPSVELA